MKKGVMRDINEVLKLINPFNPVARQLADKELVGSMQNLGFLIDQPILIGCDGLIGDGHRRLAAALAAGLAEVPVYYSSRTSVEIMATSNNLALVWTKQNWLQAWKAGFPSDWLPSKLQEILKKAGDVGARQVADGKLSSDAVNRGNTFLRREIPGFKALEPAKRQEQCRAFAKWLTVNEACGVLSALGNRILAGGSKAILDLYKRYPRKLPNSGRRCLGWKTLV
jgi:hypothetical protein